MTKLCECGCGEPTRISPKTDTRLGHRKGQPLRFINGHSGRGRKLPPRTKEHRDKLRVAALGNQHSLGKQNTLGFKHSAETIEKMSGEGNSRWKEDVGYNGVHGWVKRHKAKTGICSHCKDDVGFGTQRGTHWANVDHKYRRVLEDYIELCPGCHSAYDQANGLRYTPVGAQDAS